MHEAKFILGLKFRRPPKGAAGRRQRGVTMIRLGFTSRIALFGSAAALAMTIGGAANAQVQEQAPPQEDQSATDEDNAEIIITAQKR